MKTMEYRKMSTEQLIRHLERKDKDLERKDKDLERKDKDLERKDKEIKQFKTIIKNEKALWFAYQCSSGSKKDNEILFLHICEVLEGILHNKKLLQLSTSLTDKQFKYVLDEFIRESKKHPNAPHFAEDQYDEPGNRCKLPRKYVVLLALMRIKRGMKQQLLQVFYGIDQSTVSRYIKFASGVLQKILPTAERILEHIQKMGPEDADQLKKMIPGKGGGEIIVDGTHTQIQRPQDNHTRVLYYSGKKKIFSLNTTVIINRDGLIIAIGIPREGSTHDLAMLRDEKIDFGKQLGKIYDSDTPSHQRVTVYVDRGYVGVEQLLAGAIIKRPSRKPPNGEITPKQKLENKKISRTRIRVEHVIGTMKQYNIISSTYSGTDDNFYEDLKVVTGLVNLRLLWNAKKKRPDFI